MYKLLKRYYTIWLITAKNALQETFINRWTNSLFFLGKAVRFGMLLLFLFVLQSTNTGFGEYSSDEVVVFFLVFNLIDLTAQILYRGVYLFSQHIRTGSFDFLLIKPISALFQSLFGKPDVNDVIFLLVSAAVSLWILSGLSVTITSLSILWFIALFINGLLIATALHIVVIAVAILIIEVDNVIWMYRDMMQFGRFPVSIYMPLLKFVLFFIVPIGMMTTIPAEVLLGRTPTYSVVLSSCIGIASFAVSLKLWNWALKHYSSASS